MFSGVKVPGPVITYPLDFTWTVAKTSNKEHVRKTLCPSEILLSELIMFLQPEYNMKTELEQEMSNTKSFLELQRQYKLYHYSLRLHG